MKRGEVYRSKLTGLIIDIIMVIELAINNRKESFYLGVSRAFPQQVLLLDDTDKYLWQLMDGDNAVR